MKEGAPLADRGVRKCPICGKPAEEKSAAYPFCSDRCRTTDLGNWSSESYVTHSPLTEADEILDASDLAGRED